MNTRVMPELFSRALLLSLVQDDGTTLNEYASDARALFKCLVTFFFIQDDGTTLNEYAGDAEAFLATFLYSGLWDNAQ